MLHTETKFPAQKPPRKFTWLHSVLGILKRKCAKVLDHGVSDINHFGGPISRINDARSINSLQLTMTRVRVWHETDTQSPCQTETGQQIRDSFWKCKFTSWIISWVFLQVSGGKMDKKTSRARICKPFKEPRNRFPYWRNRFLGFLNVYKIGLCAELVFSNMYGAQELMPRH